MSRTRRPGLKVSKRNMGNRDASRVEPDVRQHVVRANRIVRDDLLAIRYDFCVLLPDDVDGDVGILRDMVERTFKPQIRRDVRQMETFVLKLTSAKPPESPTNSVPMPVLVSMLEA